MTLSVNGIIECFDGVLQVFVQCRGEIDPLVLASVPHLPSCIKMLQSEFGLKVKVKESPTQLLLQGSLLQLQCAQVCVTCS